MCHSKFVRKEFGLFVSNCGNSETPTFSAEPARVWYPVEMKSFGRCLCVSSSVLLSQRSRSMPHAVLGGRVVAVLVLLPRRPALPASSLEASSVPWYRILRWPLGQA